MDFDLTFSKTPLPVCLLFILVPIAQAKLIAEYNLRDIGEFEVVKEEYKLLYKEHFYALKEILDDFLYQNEALLLDSYDNLFNLLNDTKIDTSGEFVSIKYKLLKQLEDNKEDLMQVYMVIKYKVSEIAYKIITYIDKHNIDKQTIYYLEYTMEQALRLLKNVIPHIKHAEILKEMKQLPYLFLARNDMR